MGLVGGASTMYSYLILAQKVDELKKLGKKLLVRIN